MIRTLTSRTEPVPRHDEPLAQASLCSLCPKLCRPTCPVQGATGRESAAPWRISDAVVRGTVAGWTVPLAETVAQCTGCGACGDPCLPGTNLPEESRAARAAAHVAGASLPAAVRIRERIATTGSPRRPSSFGNDAVAGTALFLGCPARVTDDVGDAALVLFAAAGEAVSCARDERCCGAVAFDLGLVPEATALANACAPGERVVVASPSCARFMREEWPRLGVAAPSVTTAPEWLATAPLAFAEREPVAWHAPCLDRTPPPFAFTEPPAHRCSGAGAAYPLVSAEGAAAVAGARRDDLDALGGERVTGCPSAARALDATHLLVHAAGRLA